MIDERSGWNRTVQPVGAYQVILKHSEFIGTNMPRTSYRMDYFDPSDRRLKTVVKTGVKIT